MGKRNSKYPSEKDCDRLLYHESRSYYIPPKAANEQYKLNICSHMIFLGKLKMCSTRKFLKTYTLSLFSELPGKTLSVLQIIQIQKKDLNQSGVLSFFCTNYNISLIQ